MGDRDAGGEGEDRACTRSKPVVSALLRAAFGDVSRNAGIRVGRIDQPAGDAAPRSCGSHSHRNIACLRIRPCNSRRQNPRVRGSGPRTGHRMLTQSVVGADTAVHLPCGARWFEGGRPLLCDPDEHEGHPRNVKCEGGKTALRWRGERLGLALGWAISVLWRLRGRCGARDADGALTSLRPDGRPLPEAPPAPKGPALGLVDAISCGKHHRRGDGAAVAGRAAGPRLGHRSAVAPRAGAHTAGGALAEASGPRATRRRERCAHREHRRCRR